MARIGSSLKSNQQIRLSLSQSLIHIVVGHSLIKFDVGGKFDCQEREFSVEFPFSINHLN